MRWMWRLRRLRVRMMKTLGLGIGWRPELALDSRRGQAEGEPLGGARDRPDEGDVLADEAAAR